MSMPWLRRKREQPIFLTKVKNNSIQEVGTTTEEPAELDEIEGVAEEMIKAFEQKDAKKLAETLRAAFQLMELEPHEEVEHEESEEA